MGRRAAGPHFSPARGGAGMNASQHAGPDLPAVEAAARIRAGALTSEVLVAACLARIDLTDPTLRGWAGIDRDGALDRAREADALRRHGLPLGDLHGAPVALDERFGRIGESTAGGWSPHPMSDSPGDAAPAVVERLMEAGAVVIGSSRTIDPYLGHSTPAPHPRDARRTAGAPCGDAAAAVAACQVPLAVTCEARGGVMRSASYCGVFGFRPARGVISRRGAVTPSPTLDQTGVLGRTLEDVACLADVLGGYDAADAASWLRPRPRMHDGVMATPPVEPALLRLDMPYDDRLSAAGRAGFEELCDCLGARVARFPAPAWFRRLPAAHRIISEFEAGTWWRSRLERTDASPAELAGPAERGVEHGEERYRSALAAMEQARRYFSELFNDYDAIIAPATAGEAPSNRSVEDDDNVFSSIWALCGLPVLCVPLLEGESGMPVGVQSIGSSNRDDRLLRTTRWMIEQTFDRSGATAIRPLIPGDTP